jgi:hypothetical protein
MAKKNPTPKKQKEISNSFINPYNTTIGNPNNAIPDKDNRSLQISVNGDDTKPFSLGISDIDESIFYYFNEVIKPYVIQNGDRISIPIIYSSQEKWKSYQQDGYYRDDKGKIMLPLIALKRDSIDKVRSIGNKLDSNYPNNYQVFEKKYSSKNAYNHFNIINNRIPEKEYYVVVIPDYVTITYSCTIFTYYIEQMNKVIEAINYASDSYWGNPERFKFKTKIDGFTLANELQQSDEKIVKTTFNLVLDGYLIPDTIQKNLSALKKFSSKTQIIITSETVSDISQIR